MPSRTESLKNPAVGCSFRLADWIPCQSPGILALPVGRGPLECVDNFHDGILCKGFGVRVGYFDCFSGISGDMTLGALVDAGVDPRPIQEAVASLGLPGESRSRPCARGASGRLTPRCHAPHEHAHRHWHHIEAIIDTGSLTGRQKDLAKRIFLQLGEAEARVHGVDLSKIHFHEVGAVDSIIDIVGSAVGLDLLGVDRFEASPVPPGKGWIKAAHGRMALPAPATAEILKGVPLAESTVEMELTTPTGAAILTTVVERFGPLPALTIETIGLGAGTRDLPEQANILRLFVGTVELPPSSDRVWVLETNLDDLPGEVVGYTTIKLMEAGALDAFVTPIQMKKNRPGVMVSVLCDEARIPAMEEILFRETTTLGIRRYPVSRHKLKRQGRRGRDPVRPDPGQARLARGPAPDVQPRIRRLRPRSPPRTGVALREVLRRRPRRLPGDETGRARPSSRRPPRIRILTDGDSSSPGKDRFDARCDLVSGSTCSPEPWSDSLALGEPGVQLSCSGLPPAARCLCLIRRLDDRLEELNRRLRLMRGLTKSTFAATCGHRHRRPAPGRSTAVRIAPTPTPRGPVPR